ncbi:hypothetical protein DY000_02049520 [Brassica cretica]|uniref:Uncharacterized protein n=1 Tax=Brassica cretica TaxID=69181 RepID=A0ABQ7EXS9_BRACR|nr:hypothetical protein DY000_02049520 [Brassica cretica]
MHVSFSSAAAPPSLFRKMFKEDVTVIFFNGGWGEACSYSKENYTSELPDFSVVSNVFKKKQDSEQSTAELALRSKLGMISFNALKYIFFDEFLSADHPLGSHIRATLQRDGERHGPVPLFVINAFDTKINNHYKDINPSVS